MHLFDRERRAGALRLPHHLAQHFHDLVQGGVLVAAPGGQARHCRADAGWLIHLHLLGDGQVHGQVQEGVAATFLDRVVARQGGVEVGEVAVVFGMDRHEVRRERFERREHGARGLLAVHLAEEAPDLVTRGIEDHGSGVLGL